MWVFGSLIFLIPVVLIFAQWSSLTHNKAKGWSRQGSSISEKETAILCTGNVNHDSSKDSAGEDLFT